MLNFVVVYRTGGDFVADDVHALKTQVSRNLTIPHKFICLSDEDFEFPGVEVIPLEKKYPGWWSIMEAFRIVGPVVFTGLDDLIVDNIDRAGELALACDEDIFYMTRPQIYARRKGEKYCSGVMIWNGDWSWIYTKFNRSPKKYMEKFIKEQRFTTDALDRKKVDVRLFQDYFTGFYSYKNECPGGIPPEDATIVAFHGRPRPKQCHKPWALKIWRDRSMPKHPWEKIQEDKDASS